MQVQPNSGGECKDVMWITVDGFPVFRTKVLAPRDLRGCKREQADNPRIRRREAEGGMI
jgi:hypothetical protein